jgi:phage antirepressor YoqD-like protein
MNEIIIAGIQIRCDATGRYCLNDFHRAAGGEKRHAPAYWLANQQTKDLIGELESAEIPVVTVEGRAGGTFAAKELIYAYAMWISPGFHLKVIRAYDALANKPVAADPLRFLSDPAKLRVLLLDYTEKVVALESTVGEMTPKVAALERFANETKGSYSLREAAKCLQLKPKKFVMWLMDRRWIYRHPDGGRWLAFQPRLDSGMLEHKVVTGQRNDGTDWGTTQVRVTAKGLARIAELLERDRIGVPA